MSHNPHRRHVSLFLLCFRILIANFAGENGVFYIDIIANRGILLFRKHLPWGFDPATAILLAEGECFLYITQERLSCLLTIMTLCDILPIKKAVPLFASGVLIVACSSVGVARLSFMQKSPAYVGDIIIRHSNGRPLFCQKH